MRRLLVLALIAVLAIGIVGFAQQLGTREKPIYLLLVPSTNTPVIQSSGDAISDYIYEHTGLYVVARVTADYAALIEAFRTAEGDVFGIPTAAQYVEIYYQTNGGVEVALAATRNGYTYYFSSIYALRSKGYTSLSDLDGKVWIYNDPGSGSGYKYPKAYLQSKGINWSSTVETGGHVNSMIALLQGQGDFCTGYGSPPLAPQCLQDQGIRWDYGDDPELMVWDRFNNALVRDDLRWPCEDLRFAVLTDYPDVFDRVGIVDVVGPIPNDCIAFVANFPTEMKDKIVTALQDMIATPEGFAVWNDANFYQWSGMAPITDAFYDLMRLTLGYPVPTRP
jgi:phosphonate transport system substrate-binding protein